MLENQQLVQKQILEKASFKSLQELSLIAIKLSLEHIYKIYPIEFDEESKSLVKSRKFIQGEFELDEFQQKLENAINKKHITISSLSCGSQNIMMDIKLISYDEYFHIQVKKSNHNIIYFFEYIEERIKADPLFHQLI